MIAPALAVTDDRTADEPTGTVATPLERDANAIGGHASPAAIMSRATISAMGRADAQRRVRREKKVVLGLEAAISLLLSRKLDTEAAALAKGGRFSLSDN